MTTTGEDLMPTVFATRRRVRRPGSMIPCQRRDRLEVARLIDFENMKSKELAKVHRVDQRTIQRWADEARHYPEYQTIARRYERAS